MMGNPGLKKGLSQLTNINNDVIHDVCPDFTALRSDTTNNSFGKLCQLSIRHLRTLFYKTPTSGYFYLFKYVNFLVVNP